MYQAKAYVNNEFITTPTKVEIISGKTNTVVGTMTALCKDQIDHAYEIANQAFQAWSQEPKDVRIAWAKRFNILLASNVEKLAEVMNAEISKDLEEARTEVKRTVEYIEQTIKTYEEIYYQTLKVKNKIANLYRTPLGVVLAISPFNYPVNLALAKVVPAILVGNTVVFKPATNGTLVGYELAKLIHESSLPKGVFNFVTGRGREIGENLTTNQHIKMVTFTGSEQVGKEIAKNQELIPIVLELGGNDPAYVRFDANLDQAAKEVANGAFSFSGQRCTAIKRLIVHKKIADDFLGKLIVEAKQLKPIALVSKSAADYAFSLIGENKVLLGAKRIGNVIENTIVQVTNFQDLAWTEEAFGPILPVYIIDDENEVINIMNNTRYGLQCSLFTSNIPWAKKVALSMEVGTVNINRSSSRGPDIFPFSGLKDSGFGVQGIKDALLSMTKVLNVVEND